MNLFVWRSTAHHALGCGYPLADGILPVLYTDVMAKQGMKVVGNIPSSKDVLNACSAILIHDNAVLKLDACVTDDVRYRLNAHSYNGKVAFEAEATTRNHSLDVIVPLKGCNNVSKVHLDPVFAMQGLDEATNFSAKQSA